MDATTEAVTAELRSLLDDLRRCGEAPWVWHYEPDDNPDAVMAEVEKAVQAGETRLVVAPADQRGVQFTATTTMEPILSRLLAHLCGERERAFLLHLLGDRLDGDTAAVFADWLEENGRTEAGDWVRRLRVNPGDVVALWPASDQAEEVLAVRDSASALSSVKAMAGVVFVTFGRPGQEIAALYADDMRKRGWARAEEAGRRVAEEREMCAGIATEEAARCERAAHVLYAAGRAEDMHAEHQAALACRIVAERVRAREGQT